MATVEAHMDPIHGLVRIDEPGCLAALGALERDWERLKDIRALGVIGQLVGPATHSKREHHIGMYYLSTQVPDLKADQSKRLAQVCLLRGLGHLPLTYSTEEGVVLAARLSDQFRKALLATLRPVEQACRRQKAWSAKEHPVDRLVAGHDYKELYKWLSAAKVLNAKLGDEVGVHVDGLVVDLVSPSSAIHRMAEQLARIDYVQRDIYYSGVAELRFEPGMVLDGFAQPFVGAGGGPEPPTPELGLIRQARAYLYDRLYGMKDILGMDACLKKIVARLLLEGALDLHQLVDWTDHDLCSELDELGAFEEGERNVAALRKVSWTVVAQSSLRVPPAPLPDIEKRIVGCDLPQLVSYPHVLRSVVSVLKKPEHRVAVTLLAHPGARKFAPFAAAVAALERLAWEQGQRAALSPPAENHGPDLLSFAFDGRASADFDSAVEATERWLRGPGTETAAQFLRQAFQLPAAVHWPTSLAMAAVMGADFLQREDGAPAVASILVRQRTPGPLWQHMAEAMLQDASGDQPAEWVGPDGKAQELRAYLKLVTVTDPAAASWVLPNVSVIVEGRSGKVEQNEVNVVTIEAWDSGAKIVLYECSTQKSNQKALADMDKGLRLVDRPRTRFDDLEVDVRVLSPSRVGSKFLDADEFLS